MEMDSTPTPPDSNAGAVVPAILAIAGCSASENGHHEVDAVRNTGVPRSDAK
jgi:hypothetical protein